jgi:hypothetical protein
MAIALSLNEQSSASLNVITGMNVEKIISKNEDFYNILVNINIDKKAAILKDVHQIKIYSSPKSKNEIMTAFFDITMVASQPTHQAENTDEINNIITNSTFEKLRTLRQLFSELNLTPLENIDVFKKIDTTVAQKIKKGTISDTKAFGVTKRFIYEQNASNNNLYNDPRQSSNQNKNYLKYASLNSKFDNDNIDRLSNKIARFKELGLDIITDKNSGLKKFIDKERLNFSYDDKLLGTSKRISSKEYASQDIKRLLSYFKKSFNNLISAESNQNSTSSLKLKSFSNKIENIKKIIQVKRDVIDSNGYLTLVAISFNKDKITKEFKFSEVDVSDALFNFNYPTFDFDFDVTNERKTNKFSAKIFNNENKKRKYIIGYRNESKINSESYKTISEIEIEPKSYGSVNIVATKNDSYTFLANCIFNGSEYINSQYSFHRGNDHQQLNHTNVKFYCQNVSDGFLINVYDINPDMFRSISILKRNLTKKEKDFKNLRLTTRNYDFLNGNESYSLVDVDVEDKDVYEYQIILKNKNNKVFKSNYTFIEKYHKKQSIVSLIPAINSNIIQGPDSQSTEYSITLNITKNQNNDLDKIINNLLGDYFDLFEDGLKEVNQESSLIFNVQITAINLTTGEQKMIKETEDAVLEGNKITLNSFTLPLNDYVFKISPRVSLAKELIADIKSKINASSNAAAQNVFFEKETGDIEYFESQRIEKQIVISDKSISKIKDNREDFLKDGRKNRKTARFNARFNILDKKNIIDYMVMSYSINEDNAILYSVAGIPIGDTNNEESGNKQINFSYLLSSVPGKYSFMCMPVLKNGKFLNPFIIDNYINT